MKNKTIIVIPAYNEGKNIGQVLQSILMTKIDADVLVVNDGSVDDTGQIAESYGVTVVTHPCNMGYGAALQTSFRYAFQNGYEYLIQFDSDGQHHAADILLMQNALFQQHADMILGSRFLGDEEFYPGLAKIVVIQFFRIVIRALTRQKVTDPTCGFRGMNKKVFSHFSGFNQFPSDFPDADIIIDILLRDWVIKEIPVHNRLRIHGQSMHAGLNSLVYIFKVALSIIVVITNVRLHRRGE